ncbi:MAG: rRNA maturation RNase YbeY [Patescibacteria group bacterium]|mgnify:CR=1 FL=1
MIEINNLTDFAVDKAYFLGVAKKVLKGENKETENLSVAFVSADQIRNINKEYRKKNKPTDVLSFEKSPNVQGRASHIFEGDFLEVVICPAFVQEKTGRGQTPSGSKLKEELAKCLIHGILHSLGYDHERSREQAKIMFEKQDFYFSEVR